MFTLYMPLVQKHTIAKLLLCLQTTIMKDKVFKDYYFLDSLGRRIPVVGHINIYVGIC